ncbi:hypothetical protein SBV1_190074 [Verrucomicrobia bacterium]|nr:hypothetical protein SBV1_190074 [Verrucomicrobiota bacterium]
MVKPCENDSGLRWCGRGGVDNRLLERRPTGVFSLKISLVVGAVLVNITPTMKRIFTLIVLLGLVVGALVTGCNSGSDTSTPANTNAPSTPSTNK